MPCHVELIVWIWARQANVAPFVRASTVGQATNTADWT